MSKSAKLLIASFIILACSVGFFVGASIQNVCKPKPKDSHFIQRDDPHHQWKREDSEKRQPKERRHRPSLETMIQFSPEQKIKLDSHRVYIDSVKRESMQNIKQAEIELQNALATQPINESQVELAKNKLLKLNEVRLNQSIEEMRFFRATLTPEQQNSFQEMHKRKHFRQRNRNLPPPPPIEDSKE